MAGFLSWLRNGRTVEHALAAPAEQPSPETLEARLAALISFYRWQHAVHDVPVVDGLLRGVPRRRPARGLLAHLDAGSVARASSLVRVRAGLVGAAVRRCLCRRRSRRSPTAAPSQTGAVQQLDPPAQQVMLVGRVGFGCG